MSKRKARLERKANRQNDRSTRKNNKAAAKIVRKQTNTENSRRGRKMAETVVNNEMKQAEQAAESRLINREIAEEESNGVMTPKATLKAQSYLKKKGVRTFKDPEILAAQVLDFRQNEIQERIQAEREEIDNDITIPEDEKGELYPDDEDIEEEILDEEFEQANFDGFDEDSIDYLDADTIGLLYNIGKGAADKFREKQFAKGKKAFGKTKEQFEKQQALKAKGDTVANASSSAAEQTIKEQKLREYTPQIIVGVLILAAVVFAAYKANSKK